MESEDYRSPMQDIWRRDYPFEYWDNKLNKINRYNPEDRLEVLFSLMQLSDLYVHILAAKLNNPHFPWFFVKDHTSTKRIFRTLDKLRDVDDDFIHLEDISRGIDGLVGYDRVPEMEEWDVDVYDWTAVDLFGCPVEFDHENKRLSFPADRPVDYMAICNAVVNFWSENRELLNDFKHGFRIIPFDFDTLDYILNEEYIVDGIETTFEDADDIREMVLSEIGEDAEYWTLDFWRMDTDKMYGYTEITLSMYRADLDRCLVLARITLRLLNNLFGRGGSYPVVNQAAQLFEGEDEPAISLWERKFDLGFPLTKGRPEE